MRAQLEFDLIAAGVEPRNFKHLALKVEAEYAEA